MKPRVKPLPSGVWRARSACLTHEVVAPTMAEALRILSAVMRSNRVRIG